MEKTITLPVGITLLLNDVILKAYNTSNLKLIETTSPSLTIKDLREAIDKIEDWLEEIDNVKGQ